MSIWEDLLRSEHGGGGGRFGGGSGGNGGPWTVAQQSGEIEDVAIIEMESKIAEIFLEIGHRDGIIEGKLKHWTARASGRSPRLDANNHWLGLDHELRIHGNRRVPNSSKSQLHTRAE